jgi:hypothetical protein
MNYDKLVKKTQDIFEKSKPGLDSAYIILMFRFRKSYDISSIPIVIIHLNVLERSIKIKQIKETQTV